MAGRRRSGKLSRRWGPSSHPARHFKPRWQPEPMIRTQICCLPAPDSRLARARAAFWPRLRWHRAGGLRAGAARRPHVVGDEGAQAAREAALAHAACLVASRPASRVSQGGNGGNARIDWRQRGADYDIRCRRRSPGKAGACARHGAQVTLEGLEGGTREGSDAEAMLREATGWRIPVAGPGRLGPRRARAPARPISTSIRRDCRPCSARMAGRSSTEAGPPASPPLPQSGVRPPGRGLRPAGGRSAGTSP